MRKQTQRQWVELRLRADGKITRNQCLSRVPAITRLSAIIQDLESDGWQFTATGVDGDYVYTLSDRPKEKRYEFVQQFDAKGRPNGVLKITKWL